MLLAVDIGNTSTKFGVFDGEELVSRFDVLTHSDDLVADIDGRLESNFDSAIVCSVVPEAGERLERLLTHGYKVAPKFVRPGAELGLKVLHEPIETLGPDRLVNSIAASEKYGTPVVICSFGTATTIDLVDEAGVLAGGLIAPGMQLMAKALHEHTAKLPQIEAAVPDNILGTTTEDAIRSGAFSSVVGLVERAIDVIARDRSDITVVATGGAAEVIAEATDRIDIVDPDLTLDGLRLISQEV